MKVEQLMQRTVETCHADDTLNRAAQLMWERDCGCIPVVDDGGHPVGMITDRDICMAAYTQGEPLRALTVESAMAHRVCSCRPGDTVAEAERIMRAAKIRRLPVVDASNVLVGILSLNDLAQEVLREADTEHREIGDQEVAGTLGAICMPRQSHDLTATA